MVGQVLSVGGGGGVPQSAARSESAVNLPKLPGDHRLQPVFSLKSISA